MNFVCVCKNCGRTIEQEFLYCPWCGTKKTEPVLKNDLKVEIFNKLEEKQVECLDKKIKELFGKLDELEKFFSNDFK